jgi:guanylate kinase
VGKGKLVVISGPSGVGKGTALKIAMQRRPDLSFSVSATTRSPRPGEVEGKSYYFISEDKFRDMISKDEFLEYDQHNKAFYGTPREQAEEKRRSGPVLLDIDPMGAKKVKEKVPDVVLIFIMPPSVEELERRLRGRGDTSEEQIQIRMERAKWEMEQKCWYDYVVVNHEPNQCAEEILNIIG